ncbi:MAG: hypothetical protein ACLRQX_03095 [Turicibacter sanguinis]
MRGDKNEKKVQLWNNNVNIITLFRVIFTASAKNIGWGILKVKIINNSARPEYDDIVEIMMHFILQADQMDLYLTFDCGYENGNTPLILDVLKI